MLPPPPHEVLSVACVFSDLKTWFFFWSSSIMIVIKNSWQKQPFVQILLFWSPLQSKIYKRKIRSAAFLQSITVVEHILQKETSHWKVVLELQKCYFWGNHQNTQRPSHFSLSGTFLKSFKTPPKRSRPISGFRRPAVSTRGLQLAAAKGKLR